MTEIEIDEIIAKAILKCAINDVGREYPDWESATPQNREIATKCAAAAIGALNDAGYVIVRQHKRIGLHK